jgi:hypothetical protein
MTPGQAAGWPRWRTPDGAAGPRATGPTGQASRSRFSRRLRRQQSARLRQAVLADDALRLRVREHVDGDFVFVRMPYSLAEVMAVAEAAAGDGGGDAAATVVPWLYPELEAADLQAACRLAEQLATLDEEAGTPAAGAQAEGAPAEGTPGRLSQIPGR